jgi:hypothetical protein
MIQSIRLIDLKMAIAEKKYGSSRGDFDLVVEQAETNEGDLACVFIANTTLSLSLSL